MRSLQLGFCLLLLIPPHLYPLPPQGGEGEGEGGQVRELSIHIDPQEPHPGDTVRVSIVEQDLEKTPLCRFDAQSLPVYKTGQDEWRILIGIPANAAPGPHEFIIEEPGHEKQAFCLLVKPGLFPFETIIFTPDKEKLLAASFGESRKIHELLKQENPEQLWKGKFHTPISGRLLAPYGTRRRYEEFHRGVDIKSKAGKRVKAPEAGRVIYAGDFPMHGNTVIIDHGQGVMSIYLHLSEFLVKKGDLVQKNQPICRVGSTGLSTAPHLHWGIYVHGIPVDPLKWTKRKF